MSIVYGPDKVLKVVQANTREFPKAGVYNASMSGYVVSFTDEEGTPWDITLTVGIRGTQYPVRVFVGANSILEIHSHEKAC